MKRIMLTCLSLLALWNVMAQNFVLTACVPGVPEGCKVELRTEDEKMIAEGLTYEGGFVLKGSVAVPVLAELSINDKPVYQDGEYPMERGIRLMVENTEITLSAACFDSIPLLYEPGGTPLHLEPCVHVRGGVMQEHYQEWRDWIYPAELARWQVEHLEWLWQFRARKTKSDSLLPVVVGEAVEAAVAVEEEMNTIFMSRHPHYAISLALQQRRMDKVFAYDNAQLDSILTCFKDNEDRTGYDRLVGMADRMRSFTRGVRYADFPLLLPDGAGDMFSGLVRPGVWNYIDFWASWCGPCRAAIPTVKRLYAKVGEKVNIVSVSVDKNMEDWKNAMRQEQMPWQQALAAPEALKSLKADYRLSAIPYLLVIDPEGRIQMVASSPAEADAFLLKQLDQ